MELLRTPDDRFDDLPGWDFEPRYVEVPAAPPGTDRLRMHHVDEGDPAGPIVLLLHGEPSWSYLYRHMIPVLTDAGLRAVAIDLPASGGRTSRRRGPSTPTPATWPGCRRRSPCSA